VKEVLESIRICRPCGSG